MRTIYAGFSTNQKTFARLIRWATRSSVSHVYFRIPTYSITGRSWIFQASGIAVNLEGDQHFSSHAKIIREFEIDLTEEQFTELELYMLDSVAKPYSMAQLVGMCWVLLGKAFGQKFKNPYADGSKSYICVELVARILRIPGSEDLTPEDLLDYLEAHSVGNVVQL